MEAYAARVRRDAAIARRRWLARRAAGPLVWKYVDVVPAVFSACGELAAFRLIVPVPEAMGRLRGRAVLTLDRAAEILGGFRFGKSPNIHAYFASSEDFSWIERAGIGRRLPGTRFLLDWAPPGEAMLFAVAPTKLPPHREEKGFRVVTPERLIRDLLGLHGLRPDLLAEIEAKLGRR
jgi:hypothetical protein